MDILDPTIKICEGCTTAPLLWTEANQEREIVKAKKDHSKMIDERISQDLRKRHCRGADY